MKRTFNEAVDCYLQAVQNAYGHLEGVALPKELFSDTDKSGRWMLRNINGFVAYVTTSGKVLDRRFKKLEEAA